MILRLEKVHSVLAFVLLAVLFLAFNALNGLLFGGMRLDLTEQGLYSLSEGTLEVIDSIDEPVHLYFFFSNKETVDVPGVRNYAQRVRELLEEYASYSGDRLQLQVLDPEPFSETEERAAEFGLRTAQRRAGEPAIYFGLVAVDSLDRHKSIPFFDVDREAVLEYELTRLLYSVLHPQKPVVGLLSALEIEEDDPRRRNRKKQWMSIQKIRESFTLRQLPQDSVEIPEDVNVLMVVRPSMLEEGALYALDQYLLQGGKALVFDDPYSGISVEQGGEGVMPADNLFHPMLASWGMALNPDTVVADPAMAMTVNVNGRSTRHPAYIALQRAGINTEDVVTAQLDSINIGTPGSLEILEDAKTQTEVLLHTSPAGGEVNLQSLGSFQDAAQLRRFMRPGIGEKNLAVRISGEVQSSFSERPARSTANVTTREHISQGEDVNLIVVSDTDMLTDQYWVRVQNFLGRQFTTALADNGNFVLNILENLSGSSALIRVRSRGRFSRPFVVVDEIRKKADERYRLQAEQLEKRLRETEQELAQLRQQTRNVEGQERLDLKREQRQTIREYREERTSIRRQLRQVRHQLSRDIESLNVQLRFLNIVLAPLGLILLLFVAYRFYLATLRRRRV